MPTAIANNGSNCCSDWYNTCCLGRGVIDFGSGVKDGFVAALTYPEQALKNITGTPGGWSTFGAEARFDWSTNNPIFRVMNEVNTVVYGGLDLITAHVPYTVFNEWLGWDIPYFSPPPRTSYELGQNVSMLLMVAATMRVKAVKIQPVKGVTMNSPQLPGSLVSVGWLSENLGKPNLVVLDASLKVKPGEPLVPGTRYFDFDQKICDQQSNLPHMMPTPELFELEVRRLGINGDSVIVIYDQVGIYSSPRAWWMFKAMGFDQVAVLDGGFPAWLRAELPLKVPDSAPVVSGNFNSTLRAGAFCDAKQVRSALLDDQTAVIDARSEGRFQGHEPEPRSGLRSGHMPNAVNLPFTSFLENGHMLPVDRIEGLFKSVVGRPKKLIFTCGSGVTACVAAFAADILGYKDVSVYDGSWSEWGRESGLPVEKGPARK